MKNVLAIMFTLVCIISSSAICLSSAQASGDVQTDALNAVQRACHNVAITFQTWGADACYDAGIAAVIEGKNASESVAIACRAVSYNPYYYRTCMRTH